MMSTAKSSRLTDVSPDQTKTFHGKPLGKLTRSPERQHQGHGARYLFFVTFFFDFVTFVFPPGFISAVASICTFARGCNNPDTTITDITGECPSSSSRWASSITPLL